MPVRWKHPVSYATVHRREGKLPYPIPCRDLSCGVCREARKLTGDVVLALSSQHFQADSCIFMAIRSSFATWPLSDARSLIACSASFTRSSQFVSIGLKNREFVTVPTKDIRPYAPSLGTEA